MSTDNKRRRLEELRDYYVLEFEETASWRERMAAEHPQDPRNQPSAAALARAARELADLPADDPRLAALLPLLDTDDFEAFGAYAVVEDYIIPRHGFDSAEASTDGLLDSLVRFADRLLAERPAHASAADEQGPGSEQGDDPGRGLTHRCRPLAGSTSVNTRPERTERNHKMGYDCHIYDHAGLGPDAGYFGAGISVMPVLRSEMRYYDMLDDEWEPAREAESARGIPTHKLSYNEGRLVTPAEIRAALRNYDAAPYRESPEPYELLESDPEYGVLRLLEEQTGLQAAPGQRRVTLEADGWQQHAPLAANADERVFLRAKWCEWIAFLRVAGTHGGFTVW